MTNDTPIYEIEAVKFYEARIRFSDAIKARIASVEKQLGVLNKLEQRDLYLTLANQKRYDELLSKHMELSNELEILNKSE